MEFDYYADHSIAAAAVVAYTDVGGVVARVDHHRVVFVSTADVGDVLSGLLNDDGLVVILFSLHVFSEVLVRLDFISAVASPLCAL